MVKTLIEEFKKEWRRSEAMKRQMDQLMLMVMLENPDRKDMRENDGYEGYTELRKKIKELLEWKKEHGAVSESTSPSTTDMPTPYP